MVFGNESFAAPVMYAGIAAKNYFSRDWRKLWESKGSRSS